MCDGFHGKADERQVQSCVWNPVDHEAVIEKLLSLTFVVCQASEWPVCVLYPVLSCSPDPVKQKMLVQTSSNISTHLQQNAVDVFIIVGAFLVLVCSLFGYLVYLSYMNKDEANKDRLLNVLYANLSYCPGRAALPHE